MTVTNALIFDIQRFSIHDGPGIRTTVFFKGCPLKCQWCQNPESIKPVSEIVFYHEKCISCFDCKAVCPNDAILFSPYNKLDPKTDDVLNNTPRTRIDYQKCDACGECVKKCAPRALKQVGNVWDSVNLTTEVLKDKDFFEDSGGGITLSGGEPALHIDFLKHFLPMIKKNKIHINMETAGAFNWQKFGKILPFLDMIYFDLKLMDPGRHKKYTGIDNQLIKKNFTKLSESHKGLQARMPVIPSINDDKNNIDQTIRFIKQAGHSSIHLLAYHNFGESKLTRMSSSLKPLNIKSADDDHMTDISNLFTKEGIDVKLYD